MKRNRKSEQTDDHLLDLFHQLPVPDQRAIFGEVREKARDHQRVINFEQVLSDELVHAEAHRLARAAGVPIDEFAVVVNPFRYSSYFARSQKCTLAKLSSLDYGRFAEIAEAVVMVKAYKSVEFHHTLVPEDFSVHVLKGEAEIHRGGGVTRVNRTSVIEIAAGADVRLRLAPQCWITYVDHPLTTWIAKRAANDGRRGPGKEGAK